MRYYTSILETIGHTPLVKLNRIAQDVQPLMLAKVEFFNPGGSVKDRIGVGMIEALERDAIVNALTDSGESPTTAARTLGMSRATIYRKIREYGIVSAG